MGIHIWMSKTYLLCGHVTGTEILRDEVLAGRGWLLCTRLPCDSSYLDQLVKTNAQIISALLSGDTTAKSLSELHVGVLVLIPLL